MRTTLSILVPLLLLSGASAAASDASWTDVGPRTGQAVGDLLFDPSDPHTLYAGASGGFFVRSGEGGSWRASNEGLLGSGFLGLPILITDLVVHPESPDTLFAASDRHCIHKSTDRGDHWRPVCGLTVGQGERLRIHSADPDVLYSFGTASFGFYRSTDGGETWVRLNEDLSYNDVAGVVLDPDDPLSLLFAATRGGAEPGAPVGLLARSEDGGETWLELSAPPLVEGRPTVFHETGAGVLYLGTDAGELFASQDRGASWSAIGADLPLDDEVRVTAVAVDDRAPDRLFAMVGLGRFGAVDHAEPPTLFRSSDGGATWEPADTGFPAGHRVATVVFSPDDAARLFAPGSRGVFRSDDAGSTWRRSGEPLPTATADLALRPDRSDTLYLTGSAPGLFRSENAGTTWEALTPPVSDLTAAVSFVDLAVHPGVPSSLYVASLDETITMRWFRGDDGGERWAGQGETPPGTFLPHLTVLPTTPPVLLAGGISGLFRSVDEGATWSRVTAVEAPIASLTVSPAEPGRVYAGVLDPPINRPGPGIGSSGGVWRSEDRGVTWTLGSEGIPRPLSVTAVAEHPLTPSVLLAGLSFAGAGGSFGALYRSLDGGASWSPFGQGLPSLPVVAVGFHPGQPEIVLAAVEGAGVFRSLDGGESWHPAGSDLPHTWTRDLAVTPDGSALYTTTAAGLHRLDLAQELGAEPPPPGPWIEDSSLDGYRLKVRIGRGGPAELEGALEPVCIPETVCVSGALPGRSELFVRIVGPRPNGFLWPTLVRFSTSRIEVWIQQLSSGELRYYDLPAASPGSDELPGLFDRFGFRP